MNRRKFIAQSSMAAGAVVLGSACGSNAVKPVPAGPAIGLQLYTVRDEISNGLEPLIEKIARMGYTHIETFGYDKGLFFGKTPKELRNIFYQNGMLIPSGHVYSEDFLAGKDDAWKDACEAANILEQEYIVLPWMAEKFRPTNEAGYKALADRLNTAGKISKEAGLKFAYHNHDFELKYDWQAKTSLYQVLLEQTDPDLVKMEMDIFWVHYAGGDAITLFYQHPQRFHLWHVKDLNPLTRKNSDIGKGAIDFKSIFRYKSESGLRYFFVEQENYDVSPLDSIEKGIGYVKKELITV